MLRPLYPILLCLGSCLSALVCSGAAEAQGRPAKAASTQASTKASAKASASGSADPNTHRVVKGDTVDSIARRYGVPKQELCKVNGISDPNMIRIGQRLVIPQPPEPEKPVDHRQEIQVLTVSGAPSAYYFEPTGKARAGRQPVIMVLHGRGGSASAFCLRWAPVARPHGWLVCPSAPHPHGDGTSWQNDWVAGKNIVGATLAALRGKHEKRVQLRGNTLIGFSEGAFVAMNVGVRDPSTFNRWMILASDDRYWGAAGPQLLDRARGSLRRVVLITGQQDVVYEGTLRTQEKLKQVRVSVELSDPLDMGHEVALEARRSMYFDALAWLQQ